MVLAGDEDVAIVVAGAEVLRVDGATSGAFGTSTRAFTITLAVTARESQLLTAALADGDLVVTRVTGAAPAANTPPIRLDAVTRSGG